MNRASQIGGLLLLAAATGLCDQKAKPVKAPPPPRNEKPLRPLAKSAGGVKAAAPRLTNPASPAARLYQAPPEERDRAIEKLPPVRQEEIRKQLQYFDSLPRDQQQIMIRRTERFAALTPEQRRAFQQQMQAIKQLPKDRELAVRQVLRRLQLASEEERRSFLNSQAFKNRFSPEEQKIISNLSEVFVPPM